MLNIRDLRLPISQVALACDRRLTASDTRAYLQFFWNPPMSIYAHAQMSGIPRETLRVSARRLVELDWAVEGNVKRQTVIIPWMPVSVEERVATELMAIRDHVSFKGEWLMKCLLDLVVHEQRFHDNPRLSWLVTGGGSGRLELDRWYPFAKVACEFQGPQHDRISPLSPTQQSLDQQQTLDHVKASLCNNEGIKLIHVRPSELNIHTIREKVYGYLPLTPLREGRPLFRLLDQLCRSYTNHANKQ